jgi:hypothetical protein
LENRQRPKLTLKSWFVMSLNSKSAARDDYE